MLKYELESHATFSKPMELFQVIKNYFDATDAHTLRYRRLDSSNPDVDCVKKIAVYLRAERPDWPKIDFCDLCGAMEWCIEAEQVRLAAKQGKDGDTQPNEGYVKSQSKAEIIETIIKQDEKMAFPDCVKKVNTALEKQGKSTTTNYIHNVYYKHKDKQKVQDN